MPATLTLVADANPRRNNLGQLERGLLCGAASVRKKEPGSSETAPWAVLDTYFGQPAKEEAATYLDWLHHKMRVASVSCVPGGHLRTPTAAHGRVFKS